MPLQSEGACQACGDQAPRWQPHLGFLVRCSACGLVRMPDSVIAASSAADYGEAYWADACGDYLGGAHQLRQTFGARLREMARWSPAGSLLDVGCAFGLFLCEAGDRYQPCVGIDISETATRIGREQFDVDIRTGDLTQTAFPEAPFDNVCLWDTLEHLVDPGTTMTELHRLLKPGGHLFFTTVDIDSRMARFRGAGWRMLHIPTHLYFWGRSTLVPFLIRHGFEPAAMTSAPVFRSVEQSLQVLASISPSPAWRTTSRTVLRLVPGGLLRPLRGFVDLGDIVFVAARKRA